MRKKLKNEPIKIPTSDEAALTRMFKNQTKPASDQDAFNRVWQHFVVERNPQCADGDHCLYRDGDRACAFGIMLPDYLYKPELDTDSLSAESLLGRADIAEWFEHCDAHLLGALQSAHDRYFFTIADNLKEVATNYKLTVPGDTTVNQSA